MSNISEKNQIFNLKNKTIHFVDEILMIENQKYIFTEDLKCFPENEIKYITSYPTIDGIQKLVNKIKLTDFEKEQIKVDLKQLSFVNFDYESHRNKISKLIKKKKYGIFSFLF